jgi:hypothetical protein
MAAKLVNKGAGGSYPCFVWKLSQLSEAWEIVDRESNKTWLN